MWRKEQSFEKTKEELKGRRGVVDPNVNFCTQVGTDRDIMHDVSVDTVACTNAHWMAIVVDFLGWPFSCHIGWFFAYLSIGHTLLQPAKLHSKHRCV